MALRTYKVRISRNGQGIDIEVPAQTSYEAKETAERLHPGYKAIRVMGI